MWYWIKLSGGEGGDSDLWMQIDEEGKLEGKWELFFLSVVI